MQKLSISKGLHKNVSIPRRGRCNNRPRLNVAREYGVMTTPTVILFDSKDNILGRVSSVGELKVF